MTQKSEILINAQRLRFEAFSTFATSLNKCVSYNDVCAVLTSQTKFILDCFIFRVYYKYQSAEITFEVFKGECNFERNPAPAYQFEKDMIDLGLPVNYSDSDIKTKSLFNGTIFGHQKIVSISALPIALGFDHQILVSVASKERHHLLELDFRFLKLISELLSNKLFQLRLTEIVASKNEELEAKNTEITSLNKNLTKMVTVRTEELTDANEELKTLFYRTSHDFRTPLTNIMGLANLAAVITDDIEVLDLFEQCKTVAVGMDIMLAKLNLLTERVENHFQLVDFDEIVLSLQHKFDTRLQKCGGTISTQFASLPNFLSNAAILHTVIESLIDNSLNYNKGQLNIAIEIFCRDASLIIQFTDNGQGIDKRTMPKIFDMYYRGNAYSPGHGLGLYIVKKLLKTLKGEISVDSEPGAFTTFTITLPL